MNATISARPPELIQKVHLFLSRPVNIKLPEMHVLKRRNRTLGQFAWRLRNATKKRRICSCCGGQYPSSWFYNRFGVENKIEKPTFFRGKWYPARYSICEICKSAQHKADYEARSIRCSVRKNGEARDDHGTKRHRQAA